MKNYIIAALFFLLLPMQALADDPCSDLTDTAIGAALDNPSSIYDLGVAFYVGKCVKQDYAQSAKLWKKAASLGVIPAKNNLGYLMSEGLGVKKDQTGAVQLWREAAMAGHSESQVHLGDALFYGKGVPVQKTEGLAWILYAVDSSSKRSDTPDGGGGKAVQEMAKKSKSEMLASTPSLLQEASNLKASLPVHER